MATASQQNTEPLREHDQIELEKVLRERHKQLTREVEEGHQSRVNEDSFSALAGEVADAGDASTAAEQSDLRNSQIERDVTELREIDAAFGRIADGSYGTCIRCGRDIGVARLRANPSATRCIQCQSTYERQFAGSGTPSL